ncbi:type IV secretory system conjugative DNA transfer family protein [Deltaproteobacteria bacterium OttesenSCG-928-M10]|nr:type IV secretory system conjugative DNA transfer family protein [Deltaproteobacteria bacterium OttesenSCG-928-M10]
MADNKYGHQRRKKKGAAPKKQPFLVAVTLWVFAVFTWGAGRIAALFGYHAALGEPAFEAFERLWYWPWKVLTWSQEYGAKYKEMQQIVDQTYLAAVGVPMLLLLIRFASQQGLKGREDLHGSAKWATYEDIEGMGYMRGSGVYIGGWYDEKNKKQYYLRHDGPEHILVFAPTRSGKGVGLILPTLLSGEYSGGDYSSVVLDIKGENHALTAGFLNSKGHKVLRFDPSDYEGTSAAFNPFGEIFLDSPKLIPKVQEMASIIMDPNGKGLDDYWSKAGFGFLGGALLHGLIKVRSEEGRAANLYDLAVMLEDPDRPVKEVFQEMLTMRHEELLREMYPALRADLAQAAHVFVASAAQGMLSKADNELSGVVNTVTANLALFKDPVVAMNTSRSDFQLDDLMNYEVPVNLYLVISPADIDRLRPLLRIFVSQLLNRFTERMEFEDGASKASYKHRLLLLLDEFTSLGKLASVERAIAFMAGFGVKGYFIVQDTKQLNQTYGQDNALMANCHIRIAYAPTLVETAEMLSKLVGTTTVVDRKVSISQGGGKAGASRSTSVSETSRALLTPDECLRLPGISKDKKGNIKSGDMLIMTAGNPPIYGRQILYFLDPTFSKRAKMKVPGVEDGWNRGLSHSLYHPMPIVDTQPSKSDAPAISEQNALDLTAMEDSLADIYSEYLKAAEGGA